MKLLIAALTLLALTGPALAQTAVAPQVNFAYAPQQNTAVASGDAEWTLRVSPRLVAALRSSSAPERGRALHAIGNLAYATSGGADIRLAVPALLEVFRTDPDWRHRAMALRSLEVTADEGVMAALRAEAGRETHPSVQRTLLAVLVDHYGLNRLRYDADVLALAQSLRDGRRASAVR